ncbi:MAG TPA: type II secretion system protein [Acidimicrobiales bacterium]|nr:type II secretion system protein [Acidimicrobiales bacterium]
MPSADRLQRVMSGLARRAEEGAETGFTLIELMVVLLIMAILMAIAIPTFLGSRTGAQYRSVQSNLTNAIISAKALYATSGSYPTVGITAQLGAAEPELSFVVGTGPSGDVHSANPTNLSVLVSTASGTVIVFTAQTPDGRCWYAEDNVEAAGVNTADGLSTTHYDTLPGVYYAATTPGTVWGYCNANFVRTPLTNSGVNNGWALSWPN